MNLTDVRILVIGDRVWGRGKTLKEALANAHKPRKYIAYLCVDDTSVDPMGRFVFPKKDQAPVEFHRVGV
jgi:hypothetical protein